MAYARSIGVRVGEDCRLIGVTPATFGSEPFLIRIGRHVTIAGGASFITHDGAVWVFRDEHPEIERFGPILIGDNVFVGANVTLLPGVTIGDGSIVGAGSLVTKSQPGGHVIAGVPARTLCTTAEYWNRRSTEFTRIRSLPSAAKRRQLEEMFREELGT